MSGGTIGKLLKDLPDEDHSPNFQREVPIMKKGDHLVIVGMGGVGGPAAMLAKRLMPEVDVTVIREEERFIVR
jgi:hypothetical protein